MNDERTKFPTDKMISFTNTERKFFVWQLHRKSFRLKTMKKNQQFYGFKPNSDLNLWHTMRLIIRDQTDRHFLAAIIWSIVCIWLLFVCLGTGQTKQVLRNLSTSHECNFGILKPEFIEMIRRHLIIVVFFWILEL